MNKFVTPGKFRQATSVITAPDNSGLRFVLNPIDASSKLATPVNEILTKRWKEAKTQAKSWASNIATYKMGEVQTVAVQSDVWVVNMLILDADCKVDEVALEKSLKKIAAMAKYERATVHASDMLMDIPSFGTHCKTHLLDEGLSLWVYKTANTSA